MTNHIKTADGRNRRFPDHVDVTTVIGLDEENRIVVFEDWMKDYAFGLTLCCTAFDKGVEDGIVCRGCYSYDEIGQYHSRLADGSFEGVSLKV